jgi:hypothetical protein
MQIINNYSNKKIKYTIYYYNTNANNYFKFQPTNDVTKAGRKGKPQEKLCHQNTWNSF